MTIKQPIGTDYLNNPDHSLSHRVFANDDAAPNQAVVVDSNGNVGIGTTNPGAKLHLGTATADANNMLVFGEAEESSQGYQPRIHQLSKLSAGVSQDLALGATSANGGILFYTGPLAGQYSLLGTGSNVARMAINKDGNIGIGTTSPDTKLQVVGNFKSGDDNTNYLSLATDGELSLTGTARVTRHLRVGAAQWLHGASAPTAGFDGVFPYMAFDAATDDECHYTVIVPHRLDISVDVTFVVDWYYTGAQDNGTVCWGVEYKSIKAGEAVTGAGTTITETTAGTHTTGQMVRTTFTTKILASNLECCDTLALKLYRDVSADTLAVDAKLLNTHFHFTQNKLGKTT